VDDSFQPEVPGAQPEQRISHLASADSPSISDPERWYDLIDASKPDEHAVEHRPDQ